MALSNTKKVIIALVLLVLAFFAYTFFFKKSSSPDSALLVSTIGPEAGVGREFIVLLAELNSLKLDDSFFDDPVFKSLSDFGKVIDPEPAGRNNPFQPLSAVSSGSATYRDR